MRKKIVMRLRREILRRGAMLTNGGPVFSKRELSQNKIKRKETRFAFDAHHKGWIHRVIARDALDAYRTFLKDMEDFNRDDRSVN